MLIRLLSTLLRPRTNAAALNAKALAHYERGELEQAEHHFRELAKLNPADLSAWTNLAVAITGQQKYGAAVPILLQVVEMQPDLAEAHYDLGVCYSRLRRNREGIPHYQRAIALSPDLHKAHAGLANAYLESCDWPALERWCVEFRKYKTTHPARSWAQRIEPFTALMLFPGKTCREVAAQRAAEIAGSIREPLPPAQARRPQDKIRIGYVSADLFDHATAHLTYGLFEAHDRRAFDVFAYSSGPDDGSRYRKHIERTCDRFVDIRHETPAASARRMRDDAIDILVDMKGYTAHSRPEIFAMRPAPVQVSFLGYPGTMGADFIDYFISDNVATPPELDDDFTERIVRLPGSYQVNDGSQPIAETTLTRADAGLPDDAFVYCSFNRLGKIDRGIFSTWMAILRAVPHAVLWLVREDPHAEHNLKKEARGRGVDDSRIVFADKLPKAAHLARHRLADLFLDTTIYNAHTGASDALWAGLPVLTCPGGTFATRVAASLLRAVGVPELALSDLDEYRDLAIRFAREPSLLAQTRAKLERNRSSCALFDTARYVKNLERAYVRMHESRLRGLSAESFTVAEDGPRR